MIFHTMRRYLLGVTAGIAMLLMPVAFAYASTSISVQSLSPSTNVTVGTNVSFTVSVSGFNSPSYSISDSASGSSIGSGAINSSGNFSWTPTSNDIGTHNLTITVNDSSGDSATTAETIQVSAAPSLSIQSLSPSSNVSSGQTVTFTAAQTGFTNPTYSVSDSFNGSSVSSGDINSSGSFSWTPTNNDTGTHTITVTVSDSSGHSSTAAETIQVNGNANATIQGFSSGTAVIIGNPVTFTVAAPGFTNPAFALQDTFSGSASTLTSSDINTGGSFSWTPNSNDIGTHTITIYVNDSTGKNAVIHLSITVETPSIGITDIAPSTSIAPGTALAFVMSEVGFTNPSYTVNDSFSGSTVSSGDITSGQFNWTPGQNQTGTHVLTVTATDANGHTANTSITIDVNSGVSLTATAPSPSSSITAGSPVSFETYAYGFTNPTFSVQDSFGSGSSVSAGDINSSGIFIWTPTNSDAGTHTITITASDIYSHVATAVQTITVSATAAPVSTSPAPSSTASSGSASSPSGYDFETYLYPGITSPDVTALQNILIQEGYLMVPATGYYGTLTESAVEQFQAAHNLDQLGVVGPATRAVLNSLDGVQTTSTQTTAASSNTGSGYTFNNFLDVGSTGNDVTALQQKLTATGDYSGPITGYFGSLTQAAVEQFQGEHGIDQVGYVGPATRAALNQ